MEIKQDQRALSGNPVAYLSPISNKTKTTTMNNDNQHNMANYDVSSLQRAITDYRKV